MPSVDENESINPALNTAYGAKTHISAIAANSELTLSFSLPRSCEKHIEPNIIPARSTENEAPVSRT